MTAPSDRADPPMAEPGKRSSAGETGGMRATADAGIADSLQRSSERGDESGVGRAATGDASAGASGSRDDLGGKAAPGSAPGAAARSDRPVSDDRGDTSGGSRGATPSQGGASNSAKDDDEDEWRHAPVAPVDESNPLKSLGKAVGDAVTGSGPETTTPPTTTRR